MAKALMLAAWLATLAGGVVLIGGMGALSNDAGSPFPAPYKLAWTAISLEVTTLLVTLYAIALGPYRNWRTTCCAMYATVTAILVGLTNDVLTLKSGLPGANGSNTRPNTVAAGLIIVQIGNFLQMIISALFDTEVPVLTQVAGDSAKV